VIWFGRKTGCLETEIGEEMEISLRNGRGKVDPGAVDMRFLERVLQVGFNVLYFLSLVWKQHAGLTERFPFH
jgi:hypothetical protein